MKKDMDLGKIKNLVKQNGDKFVLVENGEPELVVMSFREYEKLMANESHAKSEYSPVQLRESEAVHFTDVEANRLKETEFVGLADMGSAREYRPSPPARLEDIRLEDLPI